jgi:cell division protein FtsQ
MLRSQRRIKMFQAIWRTLAISGLAGGLLWTTTQPIWVLRKSDQVIIQGNQLLSDQVIKSFLPLSYPQSLLRVQPEIIARSLESQPTIADATVTRQLFPPEVTIQVKERVPVAITLTKAIKGTVSTPTSIGLLDATGVLIPIESYASRDRKLKLPNLKVIGPLEQYRLYWTQLYQAVSSSPVKVTEIDCQDPANIILRTELGIVHLGSYSSHLTAQFKVLAQMRRLTEQVKSSQIAYIDLILQILKLLQFR